VREPMSLARYLVRSRSSAIFWMGMYEPRTSPHSISSASQQQSAASVLRPGTGFLACVGLHLITLKPPDSASAWNTGFEYIPVIWGRGAASVTGGDGPGLSDPGSVADGLSGHCLLRKQPTAKPVSRPPLFVAVFVLPVADASAMARPGQCPISTSLR